jgi:enterochelin esterase-like enzyme
MEAMRSQPQQQSGCWLHRCSAPAPAARQTFGKQLDAVKAGGVKFYWIGAGDTDFAREGSVTLAKLVEQRGFKTSYREIPGRHYWFIWRDFGEFGQVLFK